MTSCFVHKVIMDLESIYHLYINPIHRIGSMHKRSISIRARPSEVYTLVFHLASETKYYVSVTPGWHDSYLTCIQIECSFAMITISQER